MLDILITISTDTPPDFVNTCRASVRSAMLNAPFDTRVIEVAGVPGHIGEAMANGFAATDAEYVCWVDDDDFVLPNAFSCLAPHFAARPAAIFAREVHILANGRLYPQDIRHHLTVYRRPVVEAVDLTAYRAFPNEVLHRKATEPGSYVVDELSWVYMRRIRRSGGMKLRGLHSDEVL